MHSQSGYGKLFFNQQFLISIIIFVISSQSIIAQSGKSSSVSDKASEERVYQTADQMPEFPGGEEAKKRYFATALQQSGLPEDGTEKVNVYVSFIIEKDGSVSNEKIIKSISLSIDTLAVNAIKNMPQWIPGRKLDRPVRVQQILPVEFWLSENAVPVPKTIKKEVVTFNPAAVGPGVVVSTTTFDNSSGDGEVFTIVENSPSFPGGETALKQYISDSLRYIIGSLIEKRVRGTVYITFIVEKDGSISNPGILKGIDPFADASAIRIINNMPVWNPGTQKGIPQRVRVNIPIKFSY